MYGTGWSIIYMYASIDRGWLVHFIGFDLLMMVGDGCFWQRNKNNRSLHQIGLKQRLLLPWGWRRRRCAKRNESSFRFPGSILLLWSSYHHKQNKMLREMYSIAPLNRPQSDRTETLDGQMHGNDNKRPLFPLLVLPKMAVLNVGWIDYSNTRPLLRRWLSLFVKMQRNLMMKVWHALFLK
jgi:hypothetical protein